MINQDKPTSGIKSWSEEDRPREKLVLKGARSLSGAELLAILVGSGNREETAVELCRRILSDVDHNLNELASLQVGDLLKYKGIGEAKAVTIVAAMELSRRRAMAEPLLRSKINCSQDIYDIIGPMLADLPHEEFWLLILNTRLQCTKRIQIGVGGTKAVIAEQSIVWKHAIEHLAYGIVLVHNHPSGRAFPSKQDERLTQKMLESGKLLDIKLVDHVIIAANRHYSFSDSGYLD